MRILILINEPNELLTVSNNNIEVRAVNSRGRVVDLPYISDLKLSNILVLIANEAHASSQNHYFNSSVDPTKRIQTCTVSSHYFPSY
jgi:hypothetical protein